MTSNTKVARIVFTLILSIPMSSASFAQEKTDNSFYIYNNFSSMFVCATILDNKVIEEPDPNPECLWTRTDIATHNADPQYTFHIVRGEETVYLSVFPYTTRGERLYLETKGSTKPGSTRVWTLEEFHNNNEPQLGKLSVTDKNHLPLYLAINTEAKPPYQFQVFYVNEMSKITLDESVFYILPKTFSTNKK